MQTTIKDKTALSLLATLQISGITEETRDLTTLLLLPALIPPTCKFHSGGEKIRQIWKPSIVNSQDTFIIHVKVQGDIDKQLDDLREKRRLFGLKLQPLIVIV